MPVTIAGRSHAVLLLEQLDKMGRIREIAVVPDLRDRFVRRNQQQARVHQSLTDEPLVGRFEKVLAELFLERGQAPVALAGQLLDRNIVEDIALNRLLEILLLRSILLSILLLKTNNPSEPGSDRSARSS